MNIGDYVRFKDKRGNTYIRKVIDGYREHWYGCKIDKNANNVPYVSQKNIIKSSPNIEDLICVGDLIYVDIEPEYRPEYYEGIVAPRIIETLEEGEDYYMKIKYGKYVLKGILTKEQIEQMEYKL